MRPARRRQKCRPCRQNAPHAIHKQKRGGKTTTWGLVSPLTRCRDARWERVTKRRQKDTESIQVLKCRRTQLQQKQKRSHSHWCNVSQVRGSDIMVCCCCCCCCFYCCLFDYNSGLRWVWAMTLHLNVISSSTAIRMLILCCLFFFSPDCILLHVLYAYICTHLFIYVHTQIHISYISISRTKNALSFIN